MANGHGGARPGSGRKPKSPHLRGLDGGAGRRPVLGQQQAAGQASTAAAAAAGPTATAPVEEFDAPATLTPEQKAVWLELAPHAFKARTLTRSTLSAFIMLCQNVVIERRFAASVLDGGSSNHRGIVKLVQADLAAFNIRPCGKPIYEPAPAAPAAASQEQKATYW